MEGREEPRDVPDRRTVKALCSQLLHPPLRPCALNLQERAVCQRATSTRAPHASIGSSGRWREEKEGVGVEGGMTTSDHVRPHATVPRTHSGTERASWRGCQSGVSTWQVRFALAFWCHHAAMAFDTFKQTFTAKQFLALLKAGNASTFKVRRPPPVDAFSVSPDVGTAAWCVPLPRRWARSRPWFACGSSRLSCGGLAPRSRRAISPAR